MGICFVLGIKEGVLEPGRYHLERAGIKQLIDWQETVGVILVQGKQVRKRSSQEDMIAGAKAQGVRYSVRCRKNHKQFALLMKRETRNWSSGSEAGVRTEV